MKANKTKMVFTFLALAIVAIIINGIYYVIVANCTFFTFRSIVQGILWALSYPFYLWINSKRHQFFILLMIFCVFTFCLLKMFGIESFQNIIYSWKSINTIACIYYLLSDYISIYQLKNVFNTKNNGRVSYKHLKDC